MKKPIAAISLVLSLLLFIGCETQPTETTQTTTQGEVPIDMNKPMIALTFDDGPNTTTTKNVLDKLEKYDVVATFFLIGDNINPQTSEMAKRAYEMGCELGNHSKTHQDMAKMSADEIKEEVEKTSEKIKEITSVNPKVFRPPYISVSDTLFEAIDMPFVTGVGANDWEDKVTADKRAMRIINSVEDGVIILLHDFAGNEQTVEALDTIIPTLLEQGYQFVTVSQLFEYKEITPREYYLYTNVMQSSKGY